jgi:hypothetical protein
MDFTIDWIPNNNPGSAVQVQVKYSFQFFARFCRLPPMTWPPVRKSSYLNKRTRKKHRRKWPALLAVVSGKYYAGYVKKNCAALRLPSRNY